MSDGEPVAEAPAHISPPSWWIMSPTLDAPLETMPIPFRPQSSQWLLVQREVSTAPGRVHVVAEGWPRAPEPSTMTIRETYIEAIIDDGVNVTLRHQPSPHPLLTPAIEKARAERDAALARVRLLEDRLERANAELLRGRWAVRP